MSDPHFMHLCFQLLHMLSLTITKEISRLVIPLLTAYLDSLNELSQSDFIKKDTVKAKLYTETWSSWRAMCAPDSERLFNRVTVEVFIIAWNAVAEGLRLRLVEMSPIHNQEEREDEVQLISETWQAPQIPNFEARFVSLF